MPALETDFNKREVKHQCYIDKASGYTLEQTINHIIPHVPVLCRKECETYIRNLRPSIPEPKK